MTAASAAHADDTVRLGGRPCLRVPARGGGDRVLLHFHGGGYRALTPEFSAPLARRLAAHTGARALLPAYRLSPHSPFPAAVEDGLAAYADVLRDGVPAERIALVGESSGGGLALAVLLAAQDAGLARPGAAVVFSPWLDLTLTSATLDAHAGSDPVLSRASLTYARELYLRGVDPRTPTASPLFAADPALGALPPVLVQAARSEVLAGDSVRFGARMTAAGGRCTVQLWDGVTHAWQVFVGRQERSDAAAAGAAAFLDRELAGSRVVSEGRRVRERE